MNTFLLRDGLAIEGVLVLFETDSAPNNNLLTAGGKSSILIVKHNLNIRSNLIRTTTTFLLEELNLDS